MVKNCSILGIITGDGKGKTTSAIGLAIRAAGWQKRILVIQFFKNKQTGEAKILEKIEKIDLSIFGSNKLIDFKNMSEKEKRTFTKGWQYFKKQLKSNNYQMIILDEINLAIYFKLVSKKEILNQIGIAKKKNIDLIFTGRKGEELKYIINRANFVSRIENVKHHFEKNIPARRGIEY
jgi:cob(I)alamin adenosyltransferase